MSQSALTVTPENPSPPTNFGSTGAMPPNPPNYTKATYTDYADNTKFDTAPPPYYDDGSAGSPIVFATNVAALASGSGATGGGTEGTYPGTGTTGNFAGAVPASSSVPHEGAGTETSTTQSYSGNIYAPIPLVMVSAGPVQTAASILAGPNASHASSLSPTTNPTLSTISPTTSVHGTAAVTMTATGVGFNRQSKIAVAGVPQTTTFVSSTSITALVTPPAAAGTPAVTVVTGGTVVTAPQTWTIT